MTPLEFLAAVLPSAGHGTYCVAELSSPYKEHQHEETLADVMPPVEAWHAQKKNVYFALATFKTPDNRLAENAQFIKSLFIDMDGYASKK